MLDPNFCSSSLTSVRVVNGSFEELQHLDVNQIGHLNVCFMSFEPTFSSLSVLFFMNIEIGAGKLTKS